MIQNIQKNFFLLLLLIVVSLLYSCSERIDLDLDESHKRLVVEAYVTNIAGKQKVKLTTTAAYLSSEPAPLVAGASVSVSDGVSEWTFHEDSTGYYYADSLFVGEEFASYTLNIELKESVAGDVDFSANTEMVKVGIMDSIRLEKEEFNDKVIWRVLGWAENPPTIDFYIFKTYINGKCITPNFDDWFIIDDRMASSGYLAAMPVAFIDPEEDPIEVGDTVTLEAVSITEAYYDFLLEVNSESGGTNPMFSGPPANVKGNISGDGWGFFASESSAFCSTVLEE